eukprot:PhM_4_TR17532/c0_g1_i3/m.55027
MGIAATNIYYFLERNLLTMLEGGYPLLEETNPLPRLTVGAPKEKLKEVWKLLNKYKPTWDGGLGQIKDHSLVIETGDARPISHRPFHVNPLLEKILRDEIEDLLSKGVIRPSKSAWASPCFLTEKKEGDVKVKKRLVVDYRPLNAVTKRDCDGPPLVAEVLEKVASSRVYSKFDLNQGFYQLPVHPDSVEKTAFVSPMGCYEFLVMPFGVTNGPAEFQKYMRARFQCEWCEVFIDGSAQQWSCSTRSTGFLSASQNRRLKFDSPTFHNFLCESKTRMCQTFQRNFLSACIILTKLEFQGTPFLPAKSFAIEKIANCEDRTHDLGIMRPTRCRLRQVRSTMRESTQKKEGPQHDGAARNPGALQYTHDWFFI